MVVAWFEELSQHWTERTEVNHENLSQDGRCPVRYFRAASPEPEAGLLPTRPLLSELEKETAKNKNGFFLESVPELLIFETEYKNICARGICVLRLL